MKPQDVAKYYSNPEVAEKIASAAKGREAVGAYSDGRYDSRPNVVQYPNDVVALAAKGITSFHISVERWSFPMQLSTAEPESYQRLRTGWDLLLDIDSKLGWEDSASAARLICELLEKYGVHSYGLKFSGRRGFHIVVPAEAFPAEIDYKPIAAGYPHIPRVVAEFIRERIKDKLMLELTSKHTFKELLATIENPPSELNPYLFVEVEKDWGPRHLFRAPLSLNEKTWLVSLPLNKGKLAEFEIRMAQPDAVAAAPVIEPFIKPATHVGEASNLVQAALDWHSLQRNEPADSGLRKAGERQRPELKEKVPEQYFPPCMALILAGLKDGRKRSLFSLIAFLRNAGWPWPDLEAKIMEWNSKNRPPLPRNYIVGQLRWHGGQNRKISPPKCNHSQFFAPMSLCQPDKVCKGGTEQITLKNPAGYPFRSVPSLRPSKKPPLQSWKRPAASGGLACADCGRLFKSWRGLFSHKGRMH